MKPHEIAACVYKLLTEHPEKWRQGDFFIDGGCCVLGAAALCIDPLLSPDSEEDEIVSCVTSFRREFGRIVGVWPEVLNDTEGLPAVLRGLEKMITQGVENETN